MKYSYWRIQAMRLGNDLKFYTLSLFTILLLGVFSFGVLSAMDSHELSKPALQQSYSWFDGHVERTMWLNPHLVAEFNPEPEDQSPVRLTFGINTRALPKSSSYIRFWEIDDITPESTLASIRANYPTSRLSPVFHMSRSGSSPKFALPGNIKVVFKATWQSSQIDQWLQTNGLEVLEKIETIPPMYVIKTGAGLEALETANTIYRSGEVEMAMPNWWYKRVLR